MIGIKITAKERGKTPTKLAHDLQIELQRSRNSCLEAIRKELMKAAPQKSKGNVYSENRIHNYLSIPTNCIRKRGRFGGYVILDEKRLRHLKYILNDTKPHKIFGNPLLYFWWSMHNIWFCGSWVQHPGTKKNDFLARAYIRSKRWVRYYSKKHIESAIMKK